MHYANHSLLGAGFSVLSIVLGLFTFIFWLWMLIDAIKNPSLDSTQRVIWVLVIVFLPCLGSIIYFFAGRSK